MYLSPTAKPCFVVLLVLLGSPLVAATDKACDVESCGISSLRSMYWLANGNQAGSLVLRPEAAGDKQVMSLLDLREEAKKLGLDLTGVKLDMGELSRLGLPAIAQVDGNHFLVVDRIEGAFVRTMNSPLSPQVLRRDEFAKRFNGYALVPTESMAESAKSPRIWSDESVVDVGTIGANGDLTRKFVIHTNSPTSLHVKDIKTCCGTELVSSSGLDFAADRPLEVEFRFQNPGRGGQLNRTVSVVLDGVHWPVFNLGLVGWIEDLPIVSPTGIDFGTIMRGAAAEKTIFLRYVAPEQERTIKLLTSATGVSCRKGTYDQHDKTLTVAVSLETATFRGPVRERLDIDLTGDENTLRLTIPISANVITPITVWPPQLMLGLVEKGTATPAKVRLTRADKGRFSILHLASPAGISTSYAPTVDGYVVEAIVVAHTDLKIIDDCVVVTTDAADDMVIRIPVYASVEPK